MASNLSLKVVAHDEGWALAGSAAAEFSLANEYLSYLADRRYSPRTVRAYAFDLLHFCRWLIERDGSPSTRSPPTRCCASWQSVGKPRFPVNMAATSSTSAAVARSAMHQRR